jgi:hypothetical protein
VSLAGALFYFRFWCRYFCPFGAFLALSNKLALLQRLAPRRRFEHCDLGVREEYDIDCIRCNRCLTGRDTGVQRRGGQSVVDALGEKEARLPDEHRHRSQRTGQD